MYLCGHPGTGKTSTLNLVLSQMKNDAKITLINPIEIIQFNAMTYSDVKTFAYQLSDELTERLTDQVQEKNSKSKMNEEKLFN